MHASQRTIQIHTRNPPRPRTMNANCSRDKINSPVRDGIIAIVPKLRAFAISLSANVDRADDLVQETLLRALANINSFEAGTNLPAWLFMIFATCSALSTASAGVRSRTATGGMLTH